MRVTGFVMLVPIVALLAFGITARWEHKRSVDPPNISAIP